MKPENYPLSRTDNVVTQETDEDFLIYDLQTDKVFCLNRVAALVWHACDGTKNVEEISAIVGKKLKSNVSEDLIWIALDQLKKEKLLKDSHNFRIDFKNLSRREVIKKVGLASMVALPVVTSMIAPTSFQAQSAASACRSNPGDSQFNNGAGCPCNSSDDCCGVCGGAVNAMTCGGNNASDAPAICFGVTCSTPAGLGLMNVANQCPCNSNADCCAPGVCGGAANMMICGGGVC